nr:Phage minor structural protein GP20 [uncultured Mediterranean phage uvMED]BAR38211.1 Phage minor structural protein GP20 [uncultured Mediterranean phage uvMED]
MSDDTQVNQPKNDVQEAEVKQTQTDEKPTPTFNQEDVDRIVKQRLEAEKSKHQRMLDEAKKQEEELVKEKQIQEAKTKADLENLMKQRIADKDKELADWKSKVKTINVDNSILSIASKNNAVAPDQVVSLLKNEINYNDDGRVEVLDNNKNIRYNSKGELLTLEDRVNEFLDANPHFRKGSLSGTGSQSSIEGKTVKPFNIQDLDMSNAEDRQKYAEYRKKRDQGAIQINLNNK